MSAKTNKFLDQAHSSLMLFFDELRKVQNDQRSLVIMTSGFSELLINSLVTIYCKHGTHILKSMEFSLAIKILILHELNILDDSAYNELELLRKFRNKAAHIPFFTLSETDFKKIRQTKIVLDKIAENKLLHSFCLGLITDLWNLNAAKFNNLIK